MRVVGSWGGRVVGVEWATRVWRDRWLSEWWDDRGGRGDGVRVEMVVTKTLWPLMVVAVENISPKIQEPWLFSWMVNTVKTTRTNSTDR